MSPLASIGRGFNQFHFSGSLQTETDTKYLAEQPVSDCSSSGCQDKPLESHQLNPDEEYQRAIDLGKGTHGIQSLQEAMSIFKALADQGYLKAILALANIYAFNEVLKNRQNALRYMLLILETILHEPNEEIVQECKAAVAELSVILSTSGR